MSIESFVNRFNAALDESIRKAMEGPVTDSVKAAIVEAVQTEVYDAYERGDYMPYVRRDEVGKPGGPPRLERYGVEIRPIDYDVGGSGQEPGR